AQDGALDSLHHIDIGRIRPNVSLVLSGAAASGRTHPGRPAIAAAILIPALPSQPSITGAISGRLTSRISLGSASSSGTNRLVPQRIVIGRSVVERTVKNGTPSTVVSSCTPPESVTTACAPSTRPIMSMYPIGPVIVTAPSSTLASASRRRVRG